MHDECQDARTRDGRALDWANPADVPIYQDIVRQARAAGVTGFGAGPGYMRPGSMHIGFGTPGIWGADGAGSNAPDWLVEACNSPTPAAAPQPASEPPTMLASLFDASPRLLLRPRNQRQRPRSRPCNRPDPSRR